MEGGFSFGYRHGQKRSHAQTEEDEGAASPAWSPNNHDNSRDPLVHLHSHCHHHHHHHHQARQPVDDDADTLRFHLRHINNPYSSSHSHAERSTSASAVHPNTSNLQLPGIGSMPSPTPRRYVGDGFDFRRPAGASREQEATPVDLSGDDDDEIHLVLSRDEDVIDLTADDSGYGASQDGGSRGREGNNGGGGASNQNRHMDNGSHRLPRGMDIIIDLDNGEEEWSLASPPAAAPGSPEIQFLSSRVIDPPRRGQQAAFHSNNSDGDEVEFVGSNALPEAEVIRRRHQEMDRALGLLGDMRGRFTHLRAQVERFNAQVSRTAATFPRPPIMPPRGAPRARGHVHVGFAAPGILDFDMVAFDLGVEPVRAQPPPAPTYQAPPAAPEGFLRSPEEEGSLICPNCEEELCVGDNEVKRQVWIVKGCGHVYCGECTANRYTKKSSKGKEKPPSTKPFKECVVEDCGKKVSNPRTMFQIFL